MPSSVLVKTEVFEGPLDLLLELIESRKLLINDISLSQVTDEYIARVKAMAELPLDEASEFVALAATLLLIKSRSLLPSLALSEEETHDIKELQFRLGLYQLIKEAARGLRKTLGDASLYAGIPLEPEPIFVPDRHITPASVRETMHRLIAEFPKPAELPKVAVAKAVTLEEMIERLANRISSAIRLSFREFSGHTKKSTRTAKEDTSTNVKRDIVVSFLALLELVKQGIIKATQENAFDDIMLEQSDISTPSYE